MRKGIFFLMILMIVFSTATISMAAMTIKEAIEDGYTEYVSPGVYKKPGTHYTVEVELTETEKKAVQAAADAAAAGAAAATGGAQNQDFTLDITINKDAAFSDTKISDAGNGIVGIIGTIAVIIGVVMVIVAGMKYMLAPAGGKADVKSTIMPLLIGGVLVGASGWLVPSIINWASTNI